MLTALVAAILAQPAYVATRFDAGERLKALDVAWAAANTERKRAAIPEVSTAVVSFFAGGFGPVCRALDEAIATLEGRERRREDALGFRFEPAYAEPGGVGKLRVAWCYDPGPGEPIQVVAAGVRRSLASGVGAVLEVDSRRLNPDGREPEVGVLATIRAGAARRSAYLSLVKSLAKRIERLNGAKDPTARALAQRVRDEMASPGETELPLIELLLMAEELESGETTLAEFEQIPVARHGATDIRAAIPKGLSGEAVVVVALHGAGGSENLFFDAYGRGLAVREALRRGWVLISPRASRSATQDSVDWLREVRGVTPSRLFVLGHSMGGTLALATGNVRPRPSALALFAPAAGQIPPALGEVPTFVAVGKQEMAPLARQARLLADAIKPRPECRFLEVDPGEHLMVVAEALPEAFRFFDSVAKDAGR